VAGGGITSVCCGGGGGGGGATGERGAEEHAASAMARKTIGFCFTVVFPVRSEQKGQGIASAGNPVGG
jgi:hypothetical protein